MHPISRTLRSVFALLSAGVVLLTLFPRANAAPGDLFISNVGTGGQNILRVSQDGSSSVFSAVNLDGPLGLAFDPSGSLFVANKNNNIVKKYAPDGTVTDFGSDLDGLDGPFGLVTDAAGDVYVSNAQRETIVKFTPDGSSSLFFLRGGDALISRPAGLAIDAAGNVYVANAGLGNIVKITPAGEGSIFAAKGNTGLTVPFAVATDKSGNVFVANNAQGSTGSILRFTPDGQGSVFTTSNLNIPVSIAVDAAGNVFVGNGQDNTIVRFTPDGSGSPLAVNGLFGAAGLAIQPGGTSGPGPGTSHPAFFNGEANLGNGVYYLAFGGTPFGYYSYLADQHYIFHQDLGYEYVFDAADGQGGVYLYDFASNSFFYTSPSFPFPYLYDFSLNATLYYYPDTNAQGGHVYTSNPRYFFNNATGQIITK